MEHTTSSTPAPRFSIIVAMYNQAQHLPLLVKALAGQSYTDFDVHFCDDGSSDWTRFILGYGPPRDKAALAPGELDGYLETIKILKHRPFPWTYHRAKENSRSYAANCNQGARAARGEYCVFIAGDSFPEPDYLEILAEHVAPHRMVCGIRIQVDEGQGVDLDWRLKKEHIPTYPAILSAAPWELMTGNGLTIPRAALEAYGYWDEGFVGYGGEDNEIVGRMYFRGLVPWSVPDCRLYHHWHPSRGVDKPTHERAVALLSQYASYGF